MANATGFLELPDGRVVTVADGLTLGRVHSCDVVVDDGKVSRRHARLVVEGGVVEVEDLGSSNGTFLNGKRVARRLVRDGDVIQIGGTRIVFREQSAERLGSGADRGVDGPESAVEVLEFEDEVVQVRKAPPRPAPAREAHIERVGAAPLRFARSARGSGGGMLADDLRQMPPGLRALAILLGLALAAAAGLGVMRLVAG